MFGFYRSLSVFDFWFRGAENFITNAVFEENGRLAAERRREQA
jgi:hypothetical protein